MKLPLALATIISSLVQAQDDYAIVSSQALTVYETNFACTMVTTDVTALLNPIDDTRSKNQSQLVIEFNGLGDSDIQAISTISDLSNITFVIEYLIHKLSSLTLQLSTGSPSSDYHPATLSVTNSAPCLTSTITVTESLIETEPIPMASMTLEATPEGSNTIATSSPTSAFSFLHSHTSLTDADPHITFALSSSTDMPTILITADQSSLIDCSSTVLPTPVTILPTPDSVMSVITNSSSQPPPSIINEPVNLNQFEKDCLNTHNTYRSFHGADPLEWNVTLAEFAQNHLKIENCTFEHSHGPYGENMSIGFSSPQSAIEAWYVEYTQYNFATGDYSSGADHFTQLVWKSTTQLGCAQSYCGDPWNGEYFVCEYYPPGNVLGDFPQNVS